jgi:hypothetical protein
MAFYGHYTSGSLTSSSFFPIAVWDQDPAGGNVPSPYVDQAQAFKAMGINTFVDISNWPSSFGKDDGSLAAAAENGEYIIAGGDPKSDTSSTSVASIEALLAADPSAAPYFLGYQWDDEPSCTENVGSEVATIESEDPGTMTYANEGAWLADLPGNDIGNQQCLSEAESNLQAVSVASSDDYAETDPWHSNVCIGANCIWVYGQTAHNLVATAKAGEPTWEFIESGTDFGLSQQDGSCNLATNTCVKGNEATATPVQVNSSAWDALIGGANGIEWFCDGSEPENSDAGDACAGGGSDGNPVGGSTVIPANLTYIDHTIESYAPELNTPDVGGMTVSSSNSSVPVASMLKTVNGEDYLVVESNRDGSATATYSDPSLAGQTATVVYDSADHYDPANSELGETFTLSGSGSFNDSLGTSANPYQVKIYLITGSGSTTTTTVPATTTTTTVPSTTTTTVPATTTTTTVPSTTTTTTTLVPKIGVGPPSHRRHHGRWWWIERLVIPTNPGL